MTTYHIYELTHWTAIKDRHDATCRTASVAAAKRAAKRAQMFQGTHLRIETTDCYVVAIWDGYEWSGYGTGSYDA